MRLRKPCEHDRYEEHLVFVPTAKFPSPALPVASCPGGEFLPEDALVIEKVDEEWPQVFKGWGGLLNVLLDLQRGYLAADQVGEPGT